MTSLNKSPEYFRKKRIIARFDDYDVGMTIRNAKGEVVELTDFVPCLVLEDGDIVIDEPKAIEIEARILAGMAEDAAILPKYSTVSPVDHARPH